jgi:hypothetical protein
MLRGFDADGRHSETRGLTPDGRVITVPLHRHNVSLDYTRLAIGVEYAFADHWNIGLRVPFEHKNQRASIEQLAPLSASERRAILANQNIHHRDESYKGLADLNLLLSHTRSGVLRTADQLVVGLGSSIPTGKTEEDPFRLGDAGLKHLHIQFGTGTFDPLVEFHYGTPLFYNFSLSTSVRGKFPFYENSKTYRGPREWTFTAEVEYSVLDWLSLQATYLNFFQNYAYWDGVQDINSGLVVHAGLFGPTVHTGYGLPVRLNVMVPFSQKPLSGRGDSFEQGPTVFITVSRAF